MGPRSGQREKFSGEIFSVRLGNTFLAKLWLGHGVAGGPLLRDDPVPLVRLDTDLGEGHPPFIGVLVAVLPRGLLHRGPGLPEVAAAQRVDEVVGPHNVRGPGGDGDEGTGYQVRHLLAGDSGAGPSSPAKLYLLSGFNFNSCSGPSRAATIRFTEIVLTVVLANVEINFSEHVGFISTFRFE